MTPSNTEAPLDTKGLVALCDAVEGTATADQSIEWWSTRAVKLAYFVKRLLSPPSPVVEEIRKRHEADHARYTEAASLHRRATPPDRPMDLRPTPHEDRATLLRLLSTRAASPQNEPWIDADGKPWFAVSGRTFATVVKSRERLANRLFAETRAASPPKGELVTVEILGFDGDVHYRRPLGDPMIEEALCTPGYSIRGQHKCFEEARAASPGETVTREQIARVARDAFYKTDEGSDLHNSWGQVADAILALIKPQETPQ